MEALKEEFDDNEANQSAIKEGLENYDTALAENHVSSSYKKINTA
jgi:hypothetical protein